MNQKQLMQFAIEHHIAYREIGNKVVLVYRDAHAEAFFMFDEHGHYAGNLDEDIAQFMTMNARRYRVISALKLRASELGATLYRNSIITASGAYGGIAMDHRLNKILLEQSDESALRHLLGDAGMTSYKLDKTIDNLLSRLLNQTPLPISLQKPTETQTKPEDEPNLTVMLDQVKCNVDQAHADGKASDALKTDVDERMQEAMIELTKLSLGCFDDDFDEAEHQAQLDFEAYFESFCQSLPPTNNQCIS